MAAAFGIAASVAGIVSLGLELSTRISTYIDGVRRCDEEISAVHLQVKTLQSSLDILKNAVPDLALKHQSAGDAVLLALKSVEQELQALKDFIDTLTVFPGQPHSLKLDFNHAKKKMKFPFHRNDFEALQKRLDRANVALDAATRTLGLVVVSSLDRSNSVALSQLSSLCTTSADNIATSSSIKASLDTFIPRVDETLLEIKSSVSVNFPDIEQYFASMSATISRQEENITRKIQEAQDGFRAGRSGNLNQGSSMDSAEASTTLVGSNLLDRANRLSDIINDLAKKKESDTPRLLNATADQRALYRLVTSPTQLEKICTLYREEDVAENEFTIEQRDEPKLGLSRTPGDLTSHLFSKDGYMSSCICRQHRESLCRQARLGPLSASTLSSTCRKHLPECRFAKGEIVSKSKSIRFSYDGLRWLLSRAVDISLSLSTGAGGLSISPTITLRPTVDDTQAPIFRTLAFLILRFERYPRRHLPNKAIVLQLLEALVHRIVQLYISRRRSPYEVDSKGQSVLHRWTHLLYQLDNLWCDCGEYFTTMTKRLLEAGLPISLCDDQGVSPGTQLLKRNSHSVFDLKRLMPILCEEAPEASIFEKYQPIPRTYPDPVDTFIRLHNRIEAIEVLGCGPLSSAILIGNEAEVEKIIALYPSTIHEKNLVSQTPFHLAANKPKTLRLLMRAASSQEFDMPDRDGDYALDYALRLTRMLCVKKSSWVACSSCSCCECVDIFLDASWRCRFDFLQYCHSETSHAARVRVIDRLVSERAVLKSLGRQFLPFSEVNLHHLNEPFVLDSHAHSVAELLILDGIDIPASVRAPLLPQNHHRASRPMVRTSVYHQLYDSFFITGFLTGDLSSSGSNELAGLLYDKGFRDIDQVDDGYSPLSSHIYDNPRDSRPSYALWLIKHGANVLQPFPIEDRKNPRGYRYSTYKVAQSILYCNPIHHEEWSRNKRELESYFHLVSLVAPMDLHDECHCQCIEAGCHTMKALFKQAWQGITGYGSRPKISIESNLIPRIAEEISDHLQMLALDLSKWDRVIMLGLRYFTFEALELEHTCCQMPWGESEWSQEDIVEIEDVNRERLSLLELLLEDFRIAYCNFESQDKQGDKFTNFLTKEWSPRMQQALVDLEAVKLTSEGSLKAEEIGIRWAPVLEEEEDDESEDLKYWLKMLDEMMPAYT
ncbi:hypothetical protein F5Y09DRAFT_350725 [Xylaria sp. FL1042]|nr:hypothetical protein F5Y09DRAFT_350725 [Xylaria sp. FL1042]